GVISADDIHEVVATALLAVTGPQPGSRPQLAMLSNSGGMGVLLADLACQFGLAVPPLPPAARETLAARLPPFIRPTNPVDLATAAQTDPDTLFDAILVLRSAGYDAFVVFLMSVHDRAGYDGAAIVEALARAQRKSGCPVLPVLLGCQDDLVPRLLSVGLPALTDVRRAVRALALLAEAAAHREGEGRAAGGGALAGSSHGARLFRGAGFGWHRIYGDAVRGPGAGVRLDEAEAKARLRAHGLPVAEGALATTAAEAAATAKAVGFPVVLKVVSPDLPHKTEAGGVRLGLDDEAAVLAAFADIERSVRRFNPAARIRGVLVEEMVTGGVEVVLGVRRDPALGPVLLFGLGGIFVEVLRDIALRVLPITAAEARRLITEIRGYPLLAGARGRPAADVDALIELILRLDALIRTGGDELVELELNPVAVLPQGRGVRILDALWITRTPGGTSNGSLATDG
ncbi:MAG TPA: acetate--CoA ligase family protein, partial [Bacillota bacterium]